MAFDKDTGASAGKKSKRGSSKQINEIREVYSELLHNNKGKLQEWFDEVGKQDPAKALDLIPTYLQSLIKLINLAELLLFFYAQFH